MRDLKLASYLKVVSKQKESICLIFIVLILFSPALTKDFSKTDDPWMLYNNYQIYNLSAENIIKYFSTFHSGQYSPVNTLMYGVIYFFFGLKPFWYHLTSIFLHITNVLLVFCFIKKILNLSLLNHQNKKIPETRVVEIAFFTALLFGIHPMQVESVAWIAASKILLYSFLFLLGLISYLKFIEEKKISNYYLAMILFILSFGAKEQTVVFPCCLVAVDYLLNRNLLSKNVIKEKIPFFLLAITFGFIEIWAQNTGFHHTLAHKYYPFWQRLILSNFSFSEYLFKLFLPINLAKFYKFPMQIGKPFPEKYWFYPFLSFIFFAALYECFKKNKRHIIFGSFFFLINLVLALHIIPMARKAFIADRYIYLSSVGFFFILAFITINFKDSLPPVRKVLLNLITAIYLIGLMTYTLIYTYNWM
ncbi:hypothetical protein SAMN05421820_114108 [Pedobacter steynii]|uniref:Glycosyltransferase RgtA/B/C/D-like domain-containing protein n=1 Tax=Pedobacter steynii TaxID=430522 RepID=A0A1H0J908_9SPHI|nr:hypothetical protein [Pedobacter steynii]NQX43057.1 hypothetical protein [Pedobacter steynii]SDO39791.1 hypothetical protein SAMN05421820_114108 [Pedobacter steynii]